MTRTMVEAAAPHELNRCAEVLTRAFRADPICRWSWPDEEGYLEAFPRFVAAFAGGAFACGGAFQAGGHRGVALWLPPGASSDDEALGELLESTVPPAVRDDLFALFAEMDRVHPHEPDWYLPLLGVDPQHQGRGHGSALLAAMLARCDAERLPAYLEATSARNVRLYQRHGFEALVEIRVGSSPPLTPMVRRPLLAA